jgi:hypothetical protein
VIFSISASSFSSLFMLRGTRSGVRESQRHERDRIDPPQKGCAPFPSAPLLPCALLSPLYPFQIDGCARAAWPAFLHTHVCLFPRPRLPAQLTFFTRLSLNTLCADTYRSSSSHRTDRAHLQTYKPRPDTSTTSSFPPPLSSIYFKFNPR